MNPAPSFYRIGMSTGLNNDAEDADAVLLHRYAAGDSAAARVLAQSLGARVYGHALRMLDDQAEAEDVTQEALLRLWRHAADWQTGRAKVRTWVYRVTGNLCIDRLRKRQRETPLEEGDGPVSTGPGAEAQLLAAARRDALQGALNTLPERQRQAVVLRHLEGLDNSAIAEILDTSVEAVESLTARGKRALTAGLAAQKDALGYDDDTT